MRLITVHVSKTREYPIAVPRVIIGSGKEADVVIDDPTVSRKHALIRRRFGRYAVTDLGSTNGTYVNGRRIEQSSIIKSGDKLSFGAAQLAVVSKFKPVALQPQHRDIGIASDTRRFGVSPLYVRPELESA